MDGLHGADDVCMCALAPVFEPLIGDVFFGERYLAIMLLYQSVNWRSRRCRGVNFSPLSANPAWSVWKKTVLLLDPVASLWLWQLSFILFSVFSMEEPLISGIAARSSVCLSGFMLSALPLVPSPAGAGSHGRY